MKVEKHFKSVAFDMDTKALQEHYKGSDWHNAYKDIEKFMKENSFKHIQGSVYNSTTEMSDYQFEMFIHKMCQTFDWFGECVGDIRGNDQPVIDNYTHIAKSYKKTQDKSISKQKEICKDKIDDFFKQQEKSPNDIKDKDIER